MKLDSSLAPPAQTAAGPNPVQAPALDPLSGAAQQAGGQQSQPTANQSIPASAREKRAAKIIRPAAIRRLARTVHDD